MTLLFILYRIIQSIQYTAIQPIHCTALHTPPLLKVSESGAERMCDKVTLSSRPGRRPRPTTFLYSTVHFMLHRRHYLLLWSLLGEAPSTTRGDMRLYSMRKYALEAKYSGSYRCFR